MLGLSEHDKICYHSLKKGCADHIWTERSKGDIKKPQSVLEGTDDILISKSRDLESTL